MKLHWIAAFAPLVGLASLGAAPHAERAPTQFSVADARSATPARAAAPPREEASLRRQVAAMGTLLAVEVRGPDRRQALLATEQMLLAVERAEARLSTWRADSELSVAHSLAGETPEGAAGAELSALLQAELAEALEWSDALRGAFDPRIAALVRAWDLRGAGRVPTPQQIESALFASGPAAVELRAGRLLVHRPGAGIDEGGFGKGAGLDRALEALDLWVRALPGDAGAPTWARLDLGGQVAVWGEGPRELVLAHPRDRAQAVLRLHLPEGVRSAATSANGAAGGGKAPVHLLDPRTGLPAPDLGSVTALAPTALGADALSTGFFVLGPERSLRTASEHEHVHVLWLQEVAGGLEVLSSEGLAHSLEAAPGFELTAPADPSQPKADLANTTDGARRWWLRAKTDPNAEPTAEPGDGAPRNVPPTPIPPHDRDDADSSRTFAVPSDELR